MTAVACPECGGKVAYDLTCHTYPTRRDDGTEAWMACLPCDSAIEYVCTGQYNDENPGTCRWEYTHGLNPGNPRAAQNEAQRPAWLGDHQLVQGPLGMVTALPGVRMIGEDE